MKETDAEAWQPLFERAVIGGTAIACAAILVALAILGPMATGVLEYHVSRSAEYQLIGSDIVNALLIAPILLIGGAMHLLRRPGAKYWLALTPIVLFYIGFSYALGQEWGNSSMEGNAERFVWLDIALIIGGLVLGIGTLPMFRPEDAPAFDRRRLRAYVAVMAVFISLFALMWLGDLLAVMRTGDTATGAYSSSPTVWWTIRVLDLGITIPLGYISLYLLMTRTRRAYPLLLLVFGFFVTLGTAVNAMGWTMLVKDDPEFEAGALVVFGILGALSWFGLLYLVKDKLRARAG